MAGQEVGSLQGGVDARSIHRWKDSGCRRVLHFMHGARFELLIEALSYARITIARPPPSIGWARGFETRRRVPFPFVTIARRSKKNRWKHFTMDPLKPDIFVENNDNIIDLWMACNKHKHCIPILYMENCGVKVKVIFGNRHFPSLPISRREKRKFGFHDNYSTNESVRWESKK